MRKRNQKFYLANEKIVMKRMGLTPTIGSGSKWVEKEDGYNDAILAQLKSTDADSFRVTKDDMNKLEYHATIEHKTPIFVVQFLKDNSLYVMCKYEDVEDVYKGLIKKEKPVDQEKSIIQNLIDKGLVFDVSDESAETKVKAEIKDSTLEKRTEFYDEQFKERNNKK